MTTARNKLLRELPSVDSCLAHPKVQALLLDHPRQQVIEGLRAALHKLRSELLEQEGEAPSRDELQALVVAEVHCGLRAGQHLELQRVVNATGIVLHTNLGRAVLPQAAIEAITRIAGGYSNLELDLVTGQRGGRQAYVNQLLRELTGAEAALVVNNNAAAVFLCLNTLAQSKEIIVSRGEQIEIGGSFRIPDVIRKSGARLVEVGTTNRTHLADYTAAINEDTAIILKVHTSNYKIIGFTATVSREELACLGNVHGIIVMEDLGSGNLMDLSSFGLPREPTVEASIAAGVDLVTFSGDKLLGGIQAGIIAGRKQLVRKIARNPLARAVRVDKLTLAALEAILKLYRDPERIVEALPIMHMLTLEEAELQKQASMLLQAIQEAVPNHGDTHIVDVFGEVGGGTMPGTRLPGKAVAFRPYHTSVHQLQAQLRLVRAEHPEEGLMPVIVPIQDDRLIFHVRTLLSGQVKIVARALKVVLGGLAQ
jgi:L-seryl-tRNA(Ser) seleniumtransferase